MQWLKELGCELTLAPYDKRKLIFAAFLFAL